MGLTIALAIWGFAEAILFFIVPDLGISIAAVLRGRRPAVRAALAAAGGALAGIALLYGWGATDPDAARALVLRVPAIPTQMVARMQEDLAAEGWLAVIRAGVTGVPIKVAAATAASAGMGWGTFLLAALVQRLGRFLTVALAVDVVNRLLAPYLALGARLLLLGALWTAFYTWYWTMVAA